MASFAWAPDGASLLATAAVAVDPEWRGARSAEPAAARQAHAPEIAWKLPYKSDGIGYLLAREIHLFRIDARTGAAQQITDGPFDVLAHDVSPDGQRVILSLQQGNNANLFVMDLRSKQTTRLTDTPAIDTAPCYSPDGRSICFESDRGGSQQIYVMAATGGPAQRISFGEGRHSTPVWSPRGDYIAFTSQAGGGFGIIELELYHHVVGLVRRRPMR